MPIEMISPRTVYYRRPLGRHIVTKKCYSEEDESLKNVPENEFWSVRTVSNKETELYFRGHHAVLHYFTALDHNHVFTAYTNKPIICATFVCLSRKGSTNASTKSIFENATETNPTGIMLFTEDVAKYYSFTAEISSCMLPCKVSRAWSLRNCVLIERAREGMTNNSLFAMTHSLAEFTPVVFVDDAGNNGFVNDTCMRIVSLCEQSLLLMAYDERDKIFSLWRVRDAVKKDFEDLYQTNLDGSVTVRMDQNKSQCIETMGHQAESMDHDDECHISTEFFECQSRRTMDATNKSLDDLDLRSPIARSLKDIIDADLSNKRLPINNIDQIRSQSFLGKTKQHKSIVSQEPLYPKLCLQQLCHLKPHIAESMFNPNQLRQHSTPMTNGKIMNRSTLTAQLREPKGFFAEDFYERKYLCCIQNIDKQNYLQIVKFNYDGTSFTHFQEKEFPILDAVYLSKLKLIVVLEENKTLSLYTGLSFICKISLLNSLIYEPDLFEDSGLEISTNALNNIIRLSEPTDCGFTIHSTTGLSLRLYLPEMVRFHLVQKCLTTLKKLLPITIGTTLLCRWYSLNRAVDNNESTSSEWPRFVNFLLENLGFRKRKQLDRSIVGNVEDLSLENSDVSMDEICVKKSRTDCGFNSMENRAKNRDQLGEFTTLALNVADQPLVGFSTTVLYSLHLVYETEKLNFSSSLYLENLAALNCSLAFCTESGEYIEYYVTDYPDLWARVNRLPSIQQYIVQENVWEDCPPDWSRWFSCIMDDIVIDQRYPIIEDLNEMTMNLINFWLVIFKQTELLTNAHEEINKHMYKIKFNVSGTPTKYPFSASDDIVRATKKRSLKLEDVFQRAACYLSEIGFNVSDLDYINPGLAAIIKTICLNSSNNYPPDFSNSNLYSLLNRTDLDKQRSLIMPIIEENRVRDVISTPPKAYRRQSEIKQNCYSYWSNNVQLARGLPSTALRKNRALDNCYLLSIIQDDPIIRLAFPDIRVGEAYKMLQSCSPVELDVSICNNYTVEEGDSPTEALKEELDSHLKTITSQRTFALAFGRGMLGLQVLNSNNLTDSLHVPLLCLSGKYFVSDGGKPHTIENTTSVKPWPSFHNGVAAGLNPSKMNHLVDYVWILKQCPSNQLEKIDLSPEKAGVLFGLALNGHLNKLSHVTIGDTIKSMNEMATMAVLIGLSAYNLGSKNIALSKHISFHYRCLIPEEKHHDEQIPSLCQVSAIIAAGLLNFMSGDRKMAKIFIEEMGRSREYLTADGSSPIDIELTSVTAGFSVGLIMFQQGDLFCREYNSEELVRLMNYLKGGYRFPAKENVAIDAPSDSHIRTLLKNYDAKKPQPICQVDNWNSFQTANPRVLEGEYYNTDITGPGAAVALGMIFMASSNHVVARQLQCPGTFILLEEIRSPLLCLRQIAWGMIMWHEIKPNQEWVDSSIPKFVSNNALRRKPNGIAEKYWETANESYFQLLVGSCFVLGLRYAGTDNADARDTIMHFINKLLTIKKEPELMQTLNRSQYDWALSTIVLSACMITAGTGNLQLEKILRVLRSIHHPKEFANYGVNTAYSMAIGLLFLGGGKLTLSNSPRCAAILLIAFFPRFPPTYSGKRYHLQALRHLYVIATRPRIMCAVDIDTQVAVPISSRIVLKSETRNYHGCFVYPPENSSSIIEIEFYHTEDKYCPQKYKPGTESWHILLQSFLTGGYFFVKKKSPHQDLTTMLATFSPEKMHRGFQLRDYELLVDFLDALSCREISGSNQMKIIGHLTNHKSLAIKEVLSRIASLDVHSFVEVCLFYDWCQLQGHLSILSVFLVYMKVPLKSLRSIALGQDYRELLSEESWFLMTHLME